MMKGGETGVREQYRLDFMCGTCPRGILNVRMTSLLS